MQRLLDGATKADVILAAADANDRAIASTLLEAGGHLGTLFCRPDHAAKGLGLALLAEAQTSARAQGVTCKSAKASELARPVFARAGYTLLHRCDFAIPFAGERRRSTISRWKKGSEELLGRCST